MTEFLKTVHIYFKSDHISIWWPNSVVIACKLCWRSSRVDIGCHLPRKVGSQQVEQNSNIKVTVFWHRQLAIWSGLDIWFLLLRSKVSASCNFLPLNIIAYNTDCRDEWRQEDCVSNCFQVLEKGFFILLESNLTNLN